MKVRCNALLPTYWTPASWQTKLTSPVTTGEGTGRDREVHVYHPHTRKWDTQPQQIKDDPFLGSLIEIMEYLMKDYYIIVINMVMNLLNGFC